MRTIVVAASKGGAGKTSVCCLLAARAVRESTRVALFDLNSDQANLHQWWILRGEPMNPRLFPVETISRDVEVLRNENFDWLIIDTPPLDMDVIESAIIKADAVVVPVRSSMFDFASVTPIVEMCKARRRPYQFLMNAVDNGFKKLNQNIKASLINEGDIFSAQISYRMQYISALNVGKAGFEIKGGTDLLDEVNEFWTEVKRLAETRPVAGRRAAND